MNMDQTSNAHLTYSFIYFILILISWCVTTPAILCDLSKLWYKRKSKTYCELVTLNIFSIFLATIPQSTFVDIQTDKVVIWVFYTSNQNSHWGLPYCPLLHCLGIVGASWCAGNLFINHLGRNITQDDKKDHSSSSRLYCPRHLSLHWNHWKWQDRNKYYWVFISVPVFVVSINYGVEVLLFFFHI